MFKRVTNVPNIDYYEYRDIQYYNKYRYKASIKFPGIHIAGRVKTVSDLEYFAASVTRSRNGISAKTVAANLESLTKFVVWKNKNKKSGDITVRVEYTSATAYANDLELLLSLKQLLPDAGIEITESQLTTFSGTKYYAKEPKHKYRIYLKRTYLGYSNSDTTSFIDELREFLASRNKSLFPCKNLIRWSNHYANATNKNTYNFRFTDATHYVEYNDESTLSYLMLMYGEYFGKRYKLEKRPEVV
jgi:hypothetical protein